MHVFALWLLIALALSANPPAPAATYWQMRLGQWDELGSCLAQADRGGADLAIHSQCAFIFGALTSPGADSVHPLLQEDAVRAAAAGAGADIVRAVSQGAEEARRRFGHEGPQSRAVWEQRKIMAEAQVVYWRRELNVAIALEREAAQNVASVDRQLRDNTARLGFFWVNDQCLLPAVDRDAYLAWRPVHESLHTDLKMAIADLEHRSAARSDLQDKAAQAQSLVSVVTSVLGRLGGAVANVPALSHGTHATAGAFETSVQPLQPVSALPFSSLGCTAAQPTPAVSTQQTAPGTASQQIMPVHTLQQAPTMALVQQPVSVNIPQQTFPNATGQQPVSVIASQQGIPVATAQPPVPPSFPQQIPFATAQPPVPAPFTQQPVLNTLVHQVISAPTTQYTAPPSSMQPPMPATLLQLPYPFSQFSQCVPPTAGYSLPPQPPIPATLHAHAAPAPAAQPQTLFRGDRDTSAPTRRDWLFQDQTARVASQYTKPAYRPLEEILNIGRAPAPGRAPAHQQIDYPTTTTTTTASSNFAAPQEQQMTAAARMPQPTIMPPSGVFEHAAAVENVPAATKILPTIQNTSYGHPPQLGYDSGQPQAQPSGTPPSPRSSSQAHHGASRYSPYDFFQPPQPHVLQSVAVPGTALLRTPAGQVVPVNFVPQPQMPVLQAGYVVPSHGAFGHPVPTIPHGDAISTTSQPYASIYPFDPNIPKDVRPVQPAAAPAHNIYDILLQRVHVPMASHNAPEEAAETYEIGAGTAWDSSHDKYLERVANAGISPARPVSNAERGTNYIDLTYTSDSWSLDTDDSGTRQPPELPKTIIQSSSAPCCITSTPYRGTTTSAGVQSSRQTSTQSRHAGSDGQRGKVCRSQSHSDVSTTIMGSMDALAYQTAASDPKALAKSSSDPTMGSGSTSTHTGKHKSTASRRYAANLQRRSDPPVQTESEKTQHAAGTESGDTGYNVLTEKGRTKQAANAGAAYPVTASAVAQTSLLTTAAPRKSVDSSTASRLAELNINTEPFVAQLRVRLELINAEYNRWNTMLEQQTAYMNAKLDAYSQTFARTFEKDMEVALELQTFVLNVLDGVHQTTLEKYESEFEAIEAKLEPNKPALIQAREDLESASFMVSQTKVAMQSCLVRKEIVDGIIATLTKYSGSIDVPRAIAKAAGEAELQMVIVFENFKRTRAGLYKQLENATNSTGHIAVREKKISDFLQVGFEYIAKYLRGAFGADIADSEASRHLRDETFIRTLFYEKQGHYLAQAQVVSGVLAAMRQKSIIIARGKALKQFASEQRIGELVGWPLLSAPPTIHNP